ncbi:MAG: hypothetical protein F4089_04785, partial [Gammaproteobacteria bacterium]|nr:hypothetical protein [Gammaproteobacteria bacterium]
MNRLLLGCVLIAAGIVGLTLALAVTALVIDEIHYLRSLPSEPWTSVMYGRDLLIVLIATYLVPSVAGGVG